MVDLNASFFHHLLEPAVADRIRYVPAYASQDDLPLKMTALEIDHRGAPWRQRPPSYVRWAREHSFAIEPLRVLSARSHPTLETRPRKLREVRSGGTSPRIKA
jgi:hypothetical protein